MSRADSVTGGSPGRGGILADLWSTWSERAGACDPEEPARALFVCVLGLMGIGLLAQASHAATTMSVEDYHHELVGQILFRAAALFALLFGARRGPRGVQRFLPFCVALTGVFLLLVFVPPFASPRNGAHRWLDLGIVFQPSELARIVVVLWIADRCSRLGEGIRDFRRGVLPILGLALAFFAIVLVETDLGGSMLLLICALSTLWVAGARPVALLSSLVAIGGGALAGASILVPYVRHRVEVWFGRASNAQVSDALQALASGGPLGLGIGQGRFRNEGVPHLQSDYVFAQIGEELGFLGMGLVLVLLVAFLWHALRLVLSVRYRFEALAAFGLLLSVSLQAMLHVQVVAGLAPPKGMTLPFVSDGGTSLLVSSLAVGLAMGAARPRSPHSRIA